MPAEAFVDTNATKRPGQSAGFGDTSSSAFKQQTAKPRAPSAAPEGCHSPTDAAVHAGRSPSSSAAQFRFPGRRRLPQPRRRLAPRLPGTAAGPPHVSSRRPRPAPPHDDDAPAPSPAAPAPAREEPPQRCRRQPGAPRRKEPPPPAPLSGARPPGRADGGCSWAPPPEDYRSQGAAGGLCQVASNMASPCPSGPEPAAARRC